VEEVEVSLHQEFRESGTPGLNSVFSTITSAGGGGGNSNDR
jgi:hypothetical protein